MWQSFIFFGVLNIHTDMKEPCRKSPTSGDAQKLIKEIIMGDYNTILRLRWDKVQGPLRWDELLAQMEDELQTEEDEEFSKTPAA